MIFSIHVDPSVYAELQEAVSYYEDQQLGLGEKLFTDWERCIVQLIKHPLSFQMARKDFRRISLDKFPYMLIYKVEDKTVIVYKFIFSKMDEEKRYKKK